MSADNLTYEVEMFLDAIDPLIDAYDRITFGYVAIQSENQFLLRGAKLTFGIGEAPAPYGHFRSKNVRAGQYRLLELANTPRDLLRKLLSKQVDTPDGKLSFPRGPGGSVRYKYTPFNKPALDLQHRVNVLTVVGGPAPDVKNQLNLDWELMAAETPYASLQELMLTYHCFDSELQQSSYIVVEAHHIAAVDLSVTIEGTSVRPRLLLASNLKPELAKLGYCVYSGGKPITRACVSGGKMKWLPAGNSLQKGETTLEVPSGAVINCFASYMGIAQHHGWIHDPKTAQNPRRAMFSVFDPELAILQEMLAGCGKRRGSDFETGIRWLFWMLGFSVADIGGHSKTSDAPDLIATTPNGHVVVIECTTRNINHENKLSKLERRSLDVRRRLEDSGNRHFRVLPLITTCLTREDVTGDLVEAERRRICVLTNENLTSLLQRTYPLTNPDALFEEGEQLAASGQVLP